MRTAYIGIDFGTTNLKAAAVSPQGELLECLREPTPLSRDGAGEAYVPAEVGRIVDAQLRELAGRYEFGGVAVTGMCEAGLMLERGTMEPLSPILPWFDRRTRGLAEEFQAEDERNFLRTGLRNSAKYGMYKYLWLLRESGRQPEGTLWLSACDYLAWRLTGRCVTDPTFAARTYFYSLNARGWDEALLGRFGLGPGNLPELAASGAAAGRLLDPALSGGRRVPVAVCGHDHLCAAYLLEQRRPGCVCDSMGTAETFVGTRPEAPLGDAELRSGLTYGPFVEEGRQYWMANLPSSGLAMEWARRTARRRELTHDELDELLAGEVPPTGLLFFPFFTGTGTPTYRDGTGAACLGIREGTGWRELTRGVAEGVALQERYLLSLAPGGTGGPVCVVGGAARSAAWMQLKADVLRREVVCFREAEGTLLGAAALLCARQGLPFSPAPDPGRSFLPRGEDRYAAQYERYVQALRLFE